MAATIRIQVQTQGGLDQVKSDLTSLGDTAKKAGTGFSSLQEVAVGALRRVGEMAVNAGADAARAFVNWAKDGVKAAGDFEAGMNSFAAVAGDALGDSGKSLDDFKDLFISLGRELPVSTAEVQQAAIELVKGGIDPATVAAGGLRTSLDLAAAGGVGLSESATILAKQLGVWVDQAADAGTKSQFLAESADLIAQAANASTVDVHDLSLGLANAGGQAKASGLSFRETVTTMAAISAGFSSASDAGTSFKTFLARLQPTTESQADAMANLNLLTSEGKSIFYDTNGAFIGMEQTAAVLQDRLSGLSDAERIAALNAIFGADAFRTASILADKGAEGYRAMAEAMLKQGGVAQQAAQRQQGFNVAVDNLMGSLEALQLTVFSAVLPALTGLVNLVASGVNAITEYADATIAGETALSAIAGVISDALLPALAGATAALIAYGVTAIAPVLVNLNAMTAVLIFQAGVWIRNAAAVALAAAPYAAIALAIGGVILAYNKFNEKVQTGTQSLLDSRKWWQDAGDAIANYGRQTGAAKEQLAPYAATIGQLRTQIQGEIEDLGRRMAAGLVSDAQYQQEMATINQHREGLTKVTAAYNTQEQAIVRQVAAGMTATNMAANLKNETALLGDQVSLTADDLEKLGKALQKIMQEGQTALSQVAQNYSQFAAGVEQRGQEFTNKLIELEQQRATATTEEQKAGIDQQIAQLQAGYAEQEQSAAASYAAQQAAQRQHLGQMLIDYTVNQAMLGNIPKETAAGITAALEKEYGLQQSSTATTFLNMTQSIDKFAKSSGGSIDGLVTDLQGQEAAAKATQTAMDQYAKEYIAKQTNNFLEGKISAEEYMRALENIPSEVHTRVITTYESRGDNVAGGGVSGYRAEGGPVRRGAAYLVGELGPELFVGGGMASIVGGGGPEVFRPSQEGLIIPNAMLGALSHGAAATVNNTRNLTLNYTHNSSGGRASAHHDYATMASLARGMSL